MNRIAIKLTPGKLANPDADLRYALPELLAERSGGIIQDDGFDYLDGSDALVVFLRVSDLARALDATIEVIANVRVLENDLRQAALVAVERGDNFEVIYPADSLEAFVA